MNIYIHRALLSMLLLMQFGVLQRAIAQSLIPPAIETRSALTPEQVVNNLVQRNHTRAQGLAAYQGTRTYRLEYQGFLGSRNASMLVDVRYQSPGTKEFTHGEIHRGRCGQIHSKFPLQPGVSFRDSMKNTSCMRVLCQGESAFDLPQLPPC